MTGPNLATQEFVDDLKSKSLAVLKKSGPEAAIDHFVAGLKSNSETQYLGVIHQAHDPSFTDHWKGGNDEYDEDGLVALWINDFVLPQ